MAKKKSGGKAASQGTKRSGSKALSKKRLGTAATERIEKELKALAASIVKRSSESQRLCDSMTKNLIETGRELAEAQQLNRKKGVKGEGFVSWVEEPFKETYVGEHRRRLCLGRDQACGWR
jgi:hypothetical protein